MCSPTQKVFMSKTIALHVRYKSLYVSLPFSAKQLREKTTFCVVYGTWTTTANFRYFQLELNAVVAYLGWQSRISLVKYKFNFFTSRCPRRCRRRCLSSLINVIPHARTAKKITLNQGCVPFSQQIRKFRLKVKRNSNTFLGKSVQKLYTSRGSLLSPS